MSNDAVTPAVPSNPNVLVVNFLIGAGGGKSTLSHRVYTDLKESHPHNVYLVPDFAALHAFAKNDQALNDHISRMADTHCAVDLAERSGHRIILLENPMLVSLMYANEKDVPYIEELRQLVTKVNAMRPSLNLMLERSPDYVYDEKSRHLNLEEAKLVDKKIRDYHAEHAIPTVDVPCMPTQQRVDRVITNILASLEQNMLLEEASQPQQRPRRAMGR